MDSATCVIVLAGSKNTKKWQFIKRTFLPFVANEVFAHTNDKEQNEHDYQYVNSLCMGYVVYLDDYHSVLLLHIRHPVGR